MLLFLLLLLWLVLFGLCVVGFLWPMAPQPISGKAEPSEENRNSSADTISPPRRPSRSEIGPAMPAPITQPRSAHDTAQPDRLLRAVSASPCGLMKLASIDDTAPELTAV